MALRRRPTRRFRLGGRHGRLLAALRLPVLAAILCGGVVLIAGHAATVSQEAAADPSTSRLISVTIDPKDWPSGLTATFRKLLSYYGLESTLLSATLAANMHGDTCPNPNAPIPPGATVLIALSHDGPDPCQQAATAPAT
jgi:hypothetical protein